jgi:threonine/homoserine/homoserine lactone efflux protein
VQTELSHLDRDALRQLDRSVRSIRRTLVALGFGLAGILLLTTDLSQADLLRALVELASEYGALLAGAVLLWLGWQTVRGG